jgi:hypothetical protein
MQCRSVESSLSLSRELPITPSLHDSGTPFRNEKSLLNFSGSSRDKSGDGSSPLSLSRAGVRRLIGRRLPDAILHGKRSLRPRSRAVQRLASAGFRVRLFSSLGLVVAPPACEPGQDTSANSFPRLDQLAPGQPPLLAARSPGATGLASSLSGCFSFSGQRCRF